MKRDCSHLFPLISILLLFSTFSYGQAWSGILAPSRAINWANAGLQATFPDGETTPNPWTPPTRPACTSGQAGITVPVAAGTSPSSILTALQNCASANHTGSYLLLAAGTTTFSSGLNISGANYTTLRGSGPMSTFINLGASSYITLGSAGGAGYGFVTSGSDLSAGSTSVTVGTVTTNTGGPTVGNVVTFTQCDTGFTASSPITSGSSCTGSTADNGGLYFCAQHSVCMEGTPNGNPNAELESQEAIVTSSTNNGNGTYTIRFTPGLYLPNWSTTQGATVLWQGQNGVAVGNGLENMTVVLASGSHSSGVNIEPAYDSWITGVRFVGWSGNFSVDIGGHTTNNLFANNYVDTQTTASTTGTSAVGHGGGLGSAESSNLILNNIIQGGFLQGDYPSEGTVMAYNYLRDVLVQWPQGDFQHHPNAAFILREGNEEPATQDDDTAGSHFMDTWFRNYSECGDPPYATQQIPTALLIDSYARFENAIGNALGGPLCTTYQGLTGGYNTIFRFNGNSGSPDSLAQPSSMRWGNYDTVTGAARWCGNSSDPGWSTTCGSTSEVPTSLSGNAAPFDNSVPASTTLPASFFLGVSAHPSGGTGLSWWKVCTGWTTFPTSCSGTQTQPFPAIGPDVSGGNNINGYAYDIPATLAYKNLPIDSTYQRSYTVTGSSWSGGTETLTVFGLPLGTGSSESIMGGFQLTGAATACNPSGGELYITGETSATIQYALAANPGTSCTGTMRWPDVRQFDEGVYQNDLGGDTATAPPTGLKAQVN